MAPRCIFETQKDEGSRATTPTNPGLRAVTHPAIVGCSNGKVGRKLKRGNRFLKPNSELGPNPVHGSLVDRRSRCQIERREPMVTGSKGETVVPMIIKLRENTAFGSSYQALDYDSEKRRAENRG